MYLTLGILIPPFTLHSGGKYVTAVFLLPDCVILGSWKYKISVTDDPKSASLISCHNFLSIELSRNVRDTRCWLWSSDSFNNERNIASFSSLSIIGTRIVALTFKSWLPITLSMVGFAVTRLSNSPKYFLPSTNEVLACIVLISLSEKLILGEFYDFFSKFGVW